MMSKNNNDLQTADASCKETNAGTADVSGTAHVSGAAHVVESSAQMQQTLCSYITQSLLPPDCGIALKSDDDLLSIDYLDSMQFMRLVQFAEQTYRLKIPPADLLIENFQTVERLTEYLSEQMSNS